MIRGMSYPKGIFYMDKEYIAHASFDKSGNIVTHLYPLQWKGIFFVLKRILSTIPFYFAIGFLLLAMWVYNQPVPPFFLIPVLAFGYHFIFPDSLRQYHGAEHKMFSHTGSKSLATLPEIKESDIVNRNCSTNSVVIFFLLFACFFYPFGGNFAAIIGICGVLLIPRWIKPLDQSVIFPISGFLQKKVTTEVPDQKHLMVALLAYTSLTRRVTVTENILTEEWEQQKESKRMEEQKRLESLKQEESERIIEDTEWLEI